MNTKHQNADRLPPFCPACDKAGKVWKTVNREVEQEFRHEHYKVPTEVTECQHCGFRLLTDAQTDALTRNTADAYRKAHNLLTSREIVARRELMDLSQAEFAAKVGVGVASVKRWEGGLVQDRASDLLIRERTAHTQYEDDAYHLPQPRVENLVFECTAGFTRFAGAIMDTTIKACCERVVVGSEVCYSEEYAFTATA